MWASAARRRSTFATSPAKLNSREVTLEGLEDLDDEAVIAALTTVKGIGRWTAEMFLMFRLHRPDVLPVGDLGIVTAVQKAYGLRKRPTPDRLRKLGDAWKPYRTIACWYLWRSLDNQGAVSPASSAEAAGETQQMTRAVYYPAALLLVAAIVAVPPRITAQQRPRRRKAGTSPPSSARRRSWRSTRLKGRG